MDALTLLLSRGGLPGLAIGSVGAVIAGFMSGRLIARSVHNEVVRLLEKALTASEATVAEQKVQIATLMGRKDVS